MFSPRCIQLRKLSTPCPRRPLSTVQMDGECPNYCPLSILCLTVVSISETGGVMRPPVYLVGQPLEVIRLAEWCRDAGWIVGGEGATTAPPGTGLLAASLGALTSPHALPSLVRWCQSTGSWVATLDDGVDTWGFRAGGADQLRALAAVAGMIEAGGASNGPVSVPAAPAPAPAVEKRTRRTRRTTGPTADERAVVRCFIDGVGPSSVRALASSLGISPMTAAKWVAAEKEGRDE